MKKIFLLFISLLLLSSTIYADPFTKYLTKNERTKLENGEVVIKKLSNYKKLSISSNNSTKRTLDIMKKLDPSYITEIIQIKPYKGNEDIIEKVDAALMDIEDYAGIPYYSERQEKWYELYGWTKVTDLKEEENKRVVQADMYMSVFDVVKTEIETEKNEESYFYSSMNLNVLRYHDKFDAVGKKKFKSSIIIFRDGDNWILYGIGGVDVPRIPFVSDRIETSFLNRTKSFCNFIFEKL